MAVEKPAIVFVKGAAANAYPNRRGYALEGVVLHIADGTLAGMDSWFANPAAQAGTHFAVSKGGEIHQYFTLDQGPYGHGKIEPGYTAKLVRENGPAANPNWYLVGVEHEGRSGDVMPSAQLDASTRLTAWLFQDVFLRSGASGVTVDRDHVLMHRDISPQTRARCPGWGEDFHARYIAQVWKLLAGEPPAPEITLAGVKLGLIDKVLREDWQALATDAAKLAGR